MKQALQLRLGQHLTMTPQLQQAIKLLQLSTLELQQEIQTVLESNPLLEVADDIEEEGQASPSPLDSFNKETTVASNAENNADNNADAPSSEEFSNDLEWQENYDTVQPSSGSGQSDDDREFEVEPRC